MSHQKSFVKQEHQIAPELRKQINAAESTEDVKKFFSRAAQRLLKDVAGDEFNCEPEELQLMPQFQPHFELSPGAQETLKELWSASDLPAILGRFAELAAHRYIHLEKHRDKTESKMFRH